MQKAVSPAPGGPAELIRASGKDQMTLAVAGGISIRTVWKAAHTNRWPAQRRTREGLRRALGLPPEVAPIQTPAHAEPIGSAPADLRGNP